MGTVVELGGVEAGKRGGGGINLEERRKEHLSGKNHRGAEQLL